MKITSKLTGFKQIGLILTVFVIASIVSTYINTNAVAETSTASTEEQVYYDNFEDAAKDEFSVGLLVGGTSDNECCSVYFPENDVINITPNTGKYILTVRAYIPFEADNTIDRDLIIYRVYDDKTGKDIIKYDKIKYSNPYLVYTIDSNVHPFNEGNGMIRFKIQNPSVFNASAYRFYFKEVRVVRVLESTPTYPTDYSFKASEYGFPKPNNPNPVLTESKYGYSTFKSLWEKYMGPYATRVGQILKMDPGMIGGWTLHERNSSTFYDNCDDGKKEYNGDYDPNTACYPHNGVNWQIGYGVRILEANRYKNIEEAMKAMHPNETVAQVGNAVITASKTRSKQPLSDKYRFSDNITISQLISKLSDPIARVQIGILVKDDAIGTYLVGKDMKGYMGSGMARTFWGWNKFATTSYYLPQKVSNSFDAAYQAGVMTIAPIPGAPPAPVPDTPQPTTTKVIALDPGHSPSSCQEVKDGLVYAGATGEMTLNYSVATKLQSRLTAAGYKVIMTKSSLNDCVSNKKRAEIANNANATLMLRIHMDDGKSSQYFMITPNTTSAVTGLPTAASIATGNTAAHNIINALNSAKLGLTSSSDPFWPDSKAGLTGNDSNCPGLLTGSCYSKVPTTLIEMGGSENGWLNSSANQDAMATALLAGIAKSVPISTDSGPSVDARITSASGYNPEIKTVKLPSKLPINMTVSNVEYFSNGWAITTQYDSYEWIIQGLNIQGAFSQKYSTTTGDAFVDAYTTNGVNPPPDIATKTANIISGIAL